MDLSPTPKTLPHERRQDKELLLPHQEKKSRWNEPTAVLKQVVERLLPIDTFNSKHLSLQSFQKVYGYKGRQHFTQAGSGEIFIFDRDHLQTLALMLNTDIVAREGNEKLTGFRRAPGLQQGPAPDTSES